MLLWSSKSLQPLIPVTARSKASLRLLACWDCEFESHRWHECLSLVSVLFCQVEVLRRAGHSSRGVLPSVVCLSVISKPHQWGGLDPLGLRAMKTSLRNRYKRLWPTFLTISFNQPGVICGIFSARPTHGPHIFSYSAVIIMLTRDVTSHTQMSVADECSRNKENWWNDTDRENWSTQRQVEASSLRH
jgi:hypothetical protein